MVNTKICNMISKTIISLFLFYTEETKYFIRMFPLGSLLVYFLMIIMVIIFLRFFQVCALSYIIIIILIVNATTILYFYINEYKRLFFGNNPYKTVVSPGKYVKFINGIPVIDVIYDSPIIRSQILCDTVGKQFLDFYDQYIQFLYYNIKYITILSLIRNGKRQNNKINNGAIILIDIIITIFSNPINNILSEIKEKNIKFPKYYDSMIKEFILQINLIIDDENKKRFFKRKYFSYDEIKALLCVGDIYKEIGCSAAIRKITRFNKHDYANNKGTITYEFIRNLDWFSAGVLGNNSIVIDIKLDNTDDKKPKYMRCFTFIPGIFGLTYINDKGLIISINEVTRMDTKRNNFYSNITFPQFVLLEEIARNCVTLDNVRSFIKFNQPTSSHILTVLDADNKGAIFEMLPLNCNDIYKERPLEILNDYVHVTNDFKDENGNPILESMGFPCSIDRYNKMKTALDVSLHRYDVAKSCQMHDTVQTIYFTRECNYPSMNHNTNTFNEVSFANNNSADLKPVQINFDWF